MPSTDTEQFLGTPDFPGDMGMQSIFDTLCDREIAPAAEVKRRMDAYTGDFWADFCGPMIDRAEEVLFPEGEVGGADA